MREIPEGAVYIDGVLIDVDTGEVLEAPAGADKLALVVTRRAWAKVQEDTWAKAKQAYDRTLLSVEHGLPTERYEYDRVVAMVRGREGRDFSGEMMANLMLEAFPLSGAAPGAIEAWMSLVAGASGFRTRADPARLDRPFISSALQRVYDESSRFYPIKWIETRYATEDAPIVQGGAVRSSKRTRAR